MSAFDKYLADEFAYNERMLRHDCKAGRSFAASAGSVAYKSCAQWPEGCADAIGNYSEDTHATREAADAVCQMLKQHGFGGNFQHYPVRVWIEEVTPLNAEVSASARENQ